MIPTLVWTLPRPAKSRYRGAFPLYFEQNLVQLLGYPETILHPFGGMAETGTRVDLRPELEPDVIGDAHALPFEDESFDCVILDPPYSDEEAAELYQTPKLRPGVYTAEAVVLVLNLSPDQVGDGIVIPKRNSERTEQEPETEPDPDPDPERSRHKEGRLRRLLRELSVWGAPAYSASVQLRRKEKGTK